MPETKQFGRVIRDKRESLNWSLEYAAEKCGLCARALENIELGKSEPYLRTAAKITKALDIDWKDLEQCLMYMA